MKSDENTCNLASVHINKKIDTFYKFFHLYNYITKKIYNLKLFLQEQQGTNKIETDHPTIYLKAMVSEK